MTEATRDGSTILDRLAPAGAALAVVACYGTTLAVAGLSLVGVTVAVHEGAWAGVVSLFALICLAGVAHGFARHRDMPTLALAAAGAALVVWSTFGSYHRLVELAGIVMLVAAAARDWRLKRQTQTWRKQNDGFRA